MYNRQNNLGFVRRGEVKVERRMVDLDSRLISNIFEKGKKMHRKGGEEVGG